jgi:Kef-type K+ transport system membrane component KefB
MPVVAAPVAPLGAHQLLVFLLQVGVLLLLALCLGRLAVALRMPAIVGELLAGVLLGPSVLGHAAPAVAAWLLPADPAQAHLLDATGLLGVLLLVGVTGAHVDVRMLRRRRSTALRVSVAGLLLPLGLGVGLGYMLPDQLVPDGVARTTFALLLGVAMCVTAIPVIAKTLSDMRLLHRDVGQLTLAAGMVDDAVGWFLLSVVSAMATVGLHAGHLARSVLFLVGFVLLAYLVGRPAVRFLLRLAARADDPGPTVALTVVLMLLGAAATHGLGMEPIFGAFVAGILVGWPGAVDPRLLAPLRTIVIAVLAPIFLASAGLRMDLTALRDPVVLLTAAVVLLIAIVGKFLGAYLGARLSRLSRWEGLALGAGMNARGVVEVVVAMTGLRLGVLDSRMYTVIVLVAVVTSLMAPPLLRLTMARVEQNADERLREAEHQSWELPVDRRSP